MSLESPVPASEPPRADPHPEPGGLRAEVLRRLAAATGDRLDADALSEDDSLRETLGLSSLNAILLVFELEERYGIDIEDHELARIETVGQLLALIEAKEAGRG